MKNIKPNFKLIAIVLIVIIVAVVAFMYFSRKKAQAPSPVPVSLAIINSTPSDGALGVNVFDPVIITFNQTVDPTTITASSDPSEDWSVSGLSPNTVKINHKLYLRVATTYKLIVQEHASPIETLTFETAHEQNDPRFLQTIKTQEEKDYPLGSYIPYETLNYRVIYSAPLTLEIDLKTYMDQQQAISEVQSWVSSHGVDPATHKYIVVGPPSPTP